MGDIGGISSNIIVGYLYPRPYPLPYLYPRPYPHPLPYLYPRPYPLPYQYQYPLPYLYLNLYPYRALPKRYLPCRCNHKEQDTQPVQRAQAHSEPFERCETLSYLLSTKFGFHIVRIDGEVLRPDGSCCRLAQP